MWIWLSRDLYLWCFLFSLLRKKHLFAGPVSPLTSEVDWFPSTSLTLFHLRAHTKRHGLREQTLGNTLDAYLLTPVQRVPRYLLLLQQLLKEVCGNVGVPEKFCWDVGPVANLSLLACVHVLHICGTLATAAAIQGSVWSMCGHFGLALLLQKPPSVATFVLAHMFPRPDPYACL